MADFVFLHDLAIVHFIIVKNAFSGFYFSNKRVQGFSSDRKILMLFLSVLFHLQNGVSVISNFIF